MSAHQQPKTTTAGRILAAACFALLILAFASQAHSGELAWTGDRTQLRSGDLVAEWRSPKVDVELLLQEDEANDGGADIPYRVGFPMEVDLSPTNSGTWEELPGGGRLWRLKVVSEGALWTVLGFDRFQIQEGGALSISDREGKTIDGPYTAKEIRRHGELWFPPIGGETLYVELYWPKELRDVEPAIHLGTVSHGYKPWGLLGREADHGSSDSGDGSKGFGDAGSCNIDTMCPEAADWQDEKRGAVMVLVGGSGNCSGTLLNTTAGDCRTILHTAHHCGQTGPSTTIGFNFERPECGAGTPPPETNQTLTGGVLLGSWSSTDFTLIEMDEAPPEEFGAYFNGWSRDLTPPQYTYVISYPRGDAKKIAYDADPPVDGTNWGANHWRIDDSNPDPAHLAYEWGTTEPASSGSPLFDQNHRVVGQLHGGTASCTSDTYDEYGKIDASWEGGGTPGTRMREHLDPEGTGAMFVDGIDHSICLYQPAGFPLFKADLYSCSDTFEISLRDDNIPGDPITLNVTVSSSTEVVTETVTLTQIDPGVGRYSGSIPASTLPPSNGDGVLSVGHGDILTVTYVDADDGAGGTNVTVNDNADVDCQGPLITNVQSNEVTGSSALITWNTDEPADSAVTHGLTPPGAVTDTDDQLVDAHELRLFGVEECSVHYYSVASADSVGNASSDDNLGAFYTFETGRNVNPEYPSSDTPISIPDSDPAGISSTITVPDNKAVVDVDVVLNVTHTFDGDLDIDLVTPTGLSIQLSHDHGGSGENFTHTRFDDEAATSIGSGSAPFTGSFRPDQPLSAADGINAAGNWTLEIVDDAGADTGTLDAWSVILTYATQSCGPHAAFGSQATEGDDCAAGGPGEANGYWDAGEQVTFSVTVENDGTDALTGIWAEVQAQTVGVVLLDAQANYPDLPEGGSASSLAPHFSIYLPEYGNCGELLDFDVTIHANEGSWVGGFAQVVGEVVPGGGTAFTEDFEAGIPDAWRIIDGLGDGQTWYLDNTSDPAGCSNTDPQSPLAGNWAQVDSDCAGSGVSMDEELLSPTIDLTDALTATIDFDHYFHWYSSSQDEIADVDVRSVLTAGQWVNVARWQGAATANPEHASIDVTAQAAGASDLQIRWHYYNAVFEYTWSIDNVAVNFTAPGGCNMPVCAANPSAPPPIPDGAEGTQPLRADRMDPAGTQIELTWDDQCAPVNTNLLYGPLSQVAGYTIGGSVCGVAGPHLWSETPAGDLWFLLVSDDGSGAESSWGLATSGERNGLGASATCGTTVKDVSGTCP